MQIKNKIIIIAGPTASGKTKLAIDLAKRINGEIINADSRSIYKEMDIGTGKPENQLTINKKQLTKETRQLTDYLVEDIPHHLFNIKNPDESFSVYEFKRLAEKKIKEIHSRNHIPIIVGGTGLYIDSLVYNYKLPKAKPNKTLRKELERKTPENLFKELKKLDPETAQKIDPKNTRKIIRALEIFYQTKKPKVMQEKKRKIPKNILYFAIKTPREILYEKINKRVDSWIDKGFEDEVKSLLKKYPLDSPGMSGIGYKQFGLYLTGKITRKEAIERFKQGDRNLAKRQISWFKRNKEIIWIEPDVNEILSRIKSN